MFDLLKYMQQDGYLSANELIALRQTCKELGENPVRLLRSLNIASPEQIQDYLQKHFKLLILKEDAILNLDENYQVFVPIDIALFYSCFGLGEENGVVFIAMEDPSDRGLVNQLRFLLGKRVTGICATVYQLAKGLQKIYNLPIGSLMLTTPIEKSRGVIGGVRYKDAYVNSVVINDDFKGIGGLDNDYKDYEPSQEDHTNNIEDDLFQKLEDDLFPKQETHPAPDAGFLFLDGSSGSIDPSLLKIEEKIAEPVLEPSIEYDLELVHKVSSSVNTLLTKLMLIPNKENAIEIVNKFLLPQSISIMREGEINFHLKGTDFIVSSSFKEFKKDPHPIYNALMPVFKKISKLK